MAETTGDSTLSEHPDSIHFMSYEYEGQNFSVVKTPFKDFAGTTVKDQVLLKILDSQRELHGEIYGNFKNGEFFSISLTNTHTHDFKSVELDEGHVNGVVRETIAQMLIQDKVSAWLSSGTLLEGGKITYDRLLSDERLTGKKILLPKPDSDTGKPRYQYSISKRK